MAEPTCEKCGKQSFESQYLDSAKMILAFCGGCGHVVGAIPDYQTLANAVVVNLTRGCRNGTGHPVLHIKEADNIFG